jgi:hypothetical protein
MGLGTFHLLFESERLWEGIGGPTLSLPYLEDSPLRFITVDTLSG